jgi:hypothetical protein
VNGAAGIYIFPGAGANRVTGNRIEGFQWPIVDGGDDTMIRGRPTHRCSDTVMNCVDG